MAFPTALTADLHALSAAVDDTDIVATMAHLGDAAAAAVESYLGLTATAAAGTNAVQLSTMCDHGQVIGSSVTIPLTTLSAGTSIHALTTLVLYAEAPGAFVDLASDLAWMTGRTLSEYRLDQYLTRPQPGPTAHSVPALSIINQAIGVLIGRGRTPEQATQDLQSQAAARAGADLPAAAAAVLDQLS